MTTGMCRLPYPICNCAEAPTSARKPGDALPISRPVASKIAPGPALKVHVVTGGRSRSTSSDVVKATDLETPKPANAPALADTPADAVEPKLTPAATPYPATATALSPKPAPANAPAEASAEKLKPAPADAEKPKFAPAAAPPAASPKPAPAAPPAERPSPAPAPAAAEMPKPAPAAAVKPTGPSSDTSPPTASPAPALKRIDSSPFAAATARAAPGLPPLVAVSCAPCPSGGGGTRE